MASTACGAKLVMGAPSPRGAGIRYNAALSRFMSGSPYLPLRSDVSQRIDSYSASAPLRHSHNIGFGSDSTNSGDFTSGHDIGRYFLRLAEAVSELFEVAPKSLIGFREVGYRLYGVQYRSVVSVADLFPDSSQGVFGQLLGEKHGQLPGLNHFSLARLGDEQPPGHIEIVADDLLDVLDGDLLFYISHKF